MSAQPAIPTRLLLSDAVAADPFEPARPREPECDQDGILLIDEAPLPPGVDPLDIWGD